MYSRCAHVTPRRVLDTVKQASKYTRTPKQIHSLLARRCSSTCTMQLTLTIFIASSEDRSRVRPRSVCLPRLDALHSAMEWMRALLVHVQPATGYRAVGSPDAAALRLPIHPPTA